MWEIMHVYTELRSERDRLIHELAAASGGNLRDWSAYFCMRAIHECDPEAVAIAYVWLLTYAEHFTIPQETPPWQKITFKIDMRIPLQHSNQDAVLKRMGVDMWSGYGVVALHKR